MLMQIEARKQVRSSKLKEHFTKLRIIHQRLNQNDTLTVNVPKLERFTNCSRNTCIDI
jgi:hypothetical protein